MDLTKNQQYRINPHTGKRYELYGYNEKEIELFGLSYYEKELENDIKEYGVLNPICVRRGNRINPELGDKKSPYIPIDGNHRVKILYKLHPHNYKITIRLYGKDKIEKTIAY